MTRNINLSSQAWCELIFEGKNKDYGAYYLRKTSDKRHLKALFIVAITTVTLLLFMIFGSKLKATFAQQTDTGITDVVKITEVDLDVPKPEQQIVREPTPPPPALKETIKYTAPVIDSNAPDTEDMRTMDEVTKSNAIIFDKDIVGSDDPDAVDPNTLDKVVEVTAKPVVEKPFEVAEIMPAYPGGDKELMRFLSQNLKYPVVDLEQGTQGRVVLRFVVGVDGSITDIKVLRSLSGTTDKEAIRVVKSMPKWIPGRQNGKAVPVFFSLPVRFKIES